MLGLAEPMMIRSPIPNHRRNSVTYSLTSLLDIVPTLLDWFNISYMNQPHASFNANEVSAPHLTGKSLLPLLVEGKSELFSLINIKLIFTLFHYVCLEIEPVENNTSVFASQTHHEVTMYYPMRAIRTKRYKLIHNINYKMPFPIDQDFYVSPTFQVICKQIK